MDEYHMHNRSFQQIVRFINVTTILSAFGGGPWVYSYGRRSSALQFGATPVNRITPRLNVRTLARHHPLYILFRVSRELCFC